MSIKATLSLLCLTAAVSLLAQETNPNAKVEQKPTPAPIPNVTENLGFSDVQYISKKQENVASAPKDIELIMEKNTEVVLQIEPGSRLIIRNVEEKAEKTQEPKIAQTPPPATAKNTYPKTRQVSEQPKKSSATVQNNEQMPESAPAPNSPETPVKMKKDRIGVSVFGSYLYWIAREDGLEFALTGAENDLGVPPPKPGKTYRPSFKWDTGFQAGAMYRFEKSWDICFTWTRFQTDAHKRLFNSGVGNDLANSLWSVWTAPGGLAAAVNLAEAKWNLNYWTLELMTGLPFQVHDKMRLKPSAGLIQAEIKQKYDIHHTADNTFSHIIDMKNNFRGFGIRGTFDALWNINDYFGFFAKVGASLLVGKFHISEIQSTNRPFTPGVNLGGEFLNTRNRPHTIKPELDFTAGLHFVFPLFIKRSVIKIDCRWDLLLWFEQNQMMKFYGPDSAASPQSFRGHFVPQQGDLFFQGLNLTAAWEF